MGRTMPSSVFGTSEEEDGGCGIGGWKSGLSICQIEFIERGVPIVIRDFALYWPSGELSLLSLQRYPSSSVNQGLS